MEQGLQLDFLLLHGDISCLCWWIFLSEEEKWEVETDQIPFHHPAPNLQEDIFFYGKIEIPLSQTHGNPGRETCRKLLQFFPEVWKASSKAGICQRSLILVRERI